MAVVLSFSILSSVLVALPSNATMKRVVPKEPSILSISGNKPVRWQGADEVLKVHTVNAVACAIIIRGKPFIGLKYDHTIHSCGPSIFTTNIKILRNPFSFPETATFWVLANSHHITVHFPFVVIIDGDPHLRVQPVNQSTTTSTTQSTTTSTIHSSAPAIIPTPPVINLDQCTPSPNCYYGPIYSSYQTFGNMAPADLGDCTFAAAADWEQIVLGIDTNPTVIGYEFAEAGGSASTGLGQQSFFSYWENFGISGVVAKGFKRFYTDQADVQNGVRDYGAMLVAFQFQTNDGFAQYTMPAGGHEAVVDGFTPEGPLVVSWGMTLQMTWAQWNAEVVGMWGVAT